MPNILLGNNCAGSCAHGYVRGYNGQCPDLGCCVNGEPSHTRQYECHPAAPGDHLVVAVTVILSPGIVGAMAPGDPCGRRENSPIPCAAPYSLRPRPNIEMDAQVNIGCRDFLEVGPLEDSVVINLASVVGQ